MMRQGAINCVVGVLVVLGVGIGTARAGVAGQAIENHLANGDLAGGELELKQRLREKPGDAEARMGLGVVQTLRGIERLCQTLYGYGFGGGKIEMQSLPILRLPVPDNDKPKVLTYEGLRGVLESTLADLAVVQETLKQVGDSEAKLSIRPGLFRMDLNGDKLADEDEALWKLYAKYSMRSTVTKEAADDFYVGLDAGDMYWLVGHCHLVSALCEFALAHDWQLLFESTAHLLFPSVQSRYGFLSGDKMLARRGTHDALDVVSIFHLFRGRVVDRKRLNAAWVHLQAMADQKLLAWRHIVNEKDNDNEWIPSATQESVLPTLRVSVEMIAAWEEFLEEARTVLAGSKMLPFWRGTADDGIGVNLRRLFAESEGFDLIAWLQGPGLSPYLEEGRPLSDLSMEYVQKSFQGRFWSFFLIL